MVENFAALPEVCCQGPDHHICMIELYLHLLASVGKHALRLLLPCLQCAARGPNHHIDKIELYLQCI
jgi:hypothetical protein